ncbi:glycosyltransferase [Vibrio parahaemolyticus]|nr:glycosyltransferase [Vibrio parahaemolyticus]EJG2010750.1 glycosyltransferase [Vibrio parahaemolyticus]EJU8966624.1 glycosyltransferase [Vibrio parahaemolyticus]HCD1294540.1 glycosyltransferase [Vibrio parahaemolyticus]
MDTILSIIIPSYNNKTLLKECLDSIYKKPFCNSCEVIVVDGGSEDGTRELLSLYSEEQPSLKYMSEVDSGIYNAMNKGISISKGRWLYFLGTDDQILTSVVDIIDIILGVKPNKKIIAGAVEYDDGSYFQSYLNDDIFFKNTLHHQAMFYSREAIVEKGGFDESFRILGDFDLNQRIAILDNHIQSSSIKLIDVLIAKCGSQGVSKTQMKLIRKERFRLILNFRKYFVFKIKGRTWFC